MLRLLQHGLLAPAGPAAAQMHLEGLDGILVMQAEQLLFHAVQQGVRQPLDDIGLIPLPARAIPYKPAFVRVAVAHPLAVSVGKPQCIACVVLCIMLVPPRRCGAPRREKGVHPRGVRLRWGIYLAAVCHRLADGHLPIGLFPVLFVPLFAHQAGGAEHPIHAGGIGPEPERQQVAQAKVSLTLALVVALPATRHQGLKARAVPACRSAAHELGVLQRRRRGQAALHRRRPGLLLQIFPVQSVQRSLVLAEGPRLAGHISRHGKISALRIHLKPRRRVFARGAGLVPPAQNMQAGAGRRKLRIAFCGRKHGRRHLV